MPRSYLIALLCGALPLCSGLIIFIAWTQTRQGELETAGIYTILAGCFLFLIGGAALLRFCRTSPAPERRGARAGFAALLLLANFPVACGLAYTAYWLDTRYMITVSNESGELLSGALVEGGGIHEFYGEIPPGKSVRRYIPVKTDGQLVFSSRSGRHSTVVEDYVTGGQGGRRTVHVKPAGQVELSY